MSRANVILANHFNGLRQRPLEFSALQHVGWAPCHTFTRLKYSTRDTE